MNCMTEKPDGERVIGVLGWIGIVFLCLIFLPLGIILLILALIWKCGSDTHASRYRNEQIRDKAYRDRMTDEERYQEYKRRRDANN